MDLKVPADTDVSNLAAVFETYQTITTVSSGGQPVASGDILQLEVDPVDGNLYSDTLDLYFAQPGYESHFNIASKTIVTVTKE